jgi:hypothetical protein
LSPFNSLSILKVHFKEASMKIAITESLLTQQ